MTDLFSLDRPGRRRDRRRRASSAARSSRGLAARGAQVAIFDLAEARRRRRRSFASTSPTAARIERATAELVREACRTCS